jgi:hypothetical protein
MDYIPGPEQAKTRGTMFKHIVELLPNSEIYGIVSLLLFFGFFVAIIVMAWKSDKNYIRKMERLPLDSPSSNGEKFDG